MYFINMKNYTKAERGRRVNVTEFGIYILRANVQESELISAPIQQSKGASANRLTLTD